jgi:UDP-N-acetylglucosamine transferase subunit ALG13
VIFVTVGTHPGQFDRLVKRIDEIAPLIKEKIIVQRGFTKYVPKNVEYFDFADNLDTYFKDARLVITHSATSLIEFIMSHKKPIITVPRQARYSEHINDHQIEFAEYLSKHTGILCVLKIEDLTPQLLSNYHKAAFFNPKPLNLFRAKLKRFLQKPKKNE